MSTSAAFATSLAHGRTRNRGYKVCVARVISCWGPEHAAKALQARYLLEIVAGLVAQHGAVCAGRHRLPALVDGPHGGTAAGTDDPGVRSIGALGDGLTGHAGCGGSRRLVSGRTYRAHAPGSAARSAGAL